MSRFSRFAVVLFAAALLSACGTLVDKSSIPVRFEAIGATNVKCDVYNKDFRYSVNVPETVLLKKSQNDLTVDCYAPGNREKHFIVDATLSPWTFGNVVTNAAVPGGVYDYHTGGMFRYPSVITVDFSDTVATMSPLPAYHNPDTIDPATVGVENTGPRKYTIQKDDSGALRTRMAELQAERDEAMQAEREERMNAVDGGWNNNSKGKDGDGHGASSGSGSAAPAGTAQPPTLQQQFPASTSF